jgi:hypothetical protein
VLDSGTAFPEPDDLGRLETETAPGNRSQVLVQAPRIRNLVASVTWGWRQLRTTGMAPTHRRHDDDRIRHANVGGDAGDQGGGSFGFRLAAVHDEGRLLGERRGPLGTLPVRIDRIFGPVIPLVALPCSSRSSTFDRVDRRVSVGNIGDATGGSSRSHYAPCGFGQSSFVVSGRESKAMGGRRR